AQATGALCRAGKKKPRLATDSIRFTLARLSRLFDWRNALTVVRPNTLIRWHRKGFRLFWKWKSQIGQQTEVIFCNGIPPTAVPIFAFGTMVIQDKFGWRRARKQVSHLLDYFADIAKQFIGLY